MPSLIEWVSTSSNIGMGKLIFILFPPPASEALSVLSHALLVIWVNYHRALLSSC